MLSTVRHLRPLQNISFIPLKHHLHSLPHTMKAVQISKTGGPDVLQYVDIDKPTVKPGRSNSEQGKGETIFPLIILTTGQILIKNHYAGVNFIDTYHRTGLYKVSLPFILGQYVSRFVSLYIACWMIVGHCREASGVVEAVGDGVSPLTLRANDGDAWSEVGGNIGHRFRTRRQCSISIWCNVCRVHVGSSKYVL